jgi:hypothetical protein
MATEGEFIDVNRPGRWCQEEDHPVAPEGCEDHRLLTTSDWHYTGRVADGSQFDSSVDRGSLQFYRWSRQVIKGWDDGLLMKVGESFARNQPEYGYGALIPPKTQAMLHFISMWTARIQEVFTER